MPITWLKKYNESGKATFGKNYMLINKSFADKFKSAYVALVGIDENNDLLIKPLSLDESESPKYKDALLIKISNFDTYVRLGNVSSMKLISESLDIDIPKEGIKYDTSWLEEEKALKIVVGGKK